MCLCALLAKMLHTSLSLQTLVYLSLSALALSESAYRNSTAGNNVATITLAPRSHYMEKAVYTPSIAYTKVSWQLTYQIANPPAITGTNIVVIPRASQPDGVDFYLPQQLATVVNKTIAEKCTSQDKSNCVSSILSII